MSLLVALLTVHFTFSEVSAWKYVEARGEWIAAFQARVENLTGHDWMSLKLRVHSSCSDGNHSYDLLFHNVTLETRSLQQTAFDAPARNSACDGPVNVEVLDARLTPDDQRPSFIVFGFQLTDSTGNVSKDLEGIVDYRRRTDTDIGTERLFWRDGGEQLEPGIYRFRVRPGLMGLAGFLLNRDPASNGPLSRFLRMYDVPPGKEAWLGIFEVTSGPGALSSVVLNPAPALRDRLSASRRRQLIAVPVQRPSASSSLTISR